MVLFTIFNHLVDYVQLVIVLKTNLNIAYLQHSELFTIPL